MQAAVLGTGKTKNVYSVQITGSSMTTESVCQFQINVIASIPKELVFHVI
jgi:hypothetical protein